MTKNPLLDDTMPGLLPPHLKIGESEGLYHAELELLRLMDERCIAWGLTRKQLAETFGVSPVLFLEYRTGKRNLRRAPSELLEQIAQFIDWPEDKVFRWIGRPYPG